MGGGERVLSSQFEKERIQNFKGSLFQTVFGDQSRRSFFSKMSKGPPKIFSKSYPRIWPFWRHHASEPIIADAILADTNLADPFWIFLKDRLILYIDTWGMKFKKSRFLET